MEERRGPEYISASAFAAKKARVKRKYMWVLPPLAGVALAYLVIALWVPRRTAADQVAHMVELIKLHPNFHTTEHQGLGDGQSVMREDFVINGKRRSELFNGDIVFMSMGNGTDVFEKSSMLLRKHPGDSSALAEAAPLRLLADAMDPRVSIGTRRNGLISLDLKNRRHEVHLDDKGLPDQWDTYYRTDRGFELLLRTQTEWDTDDESALTRAWPPDVVGAVEMAAVQNPEAPEAKKLESLGDLDLIEANLNAYGDLILAYRGPHERPFFEVTTETGTGTYGVVRLLEGRVEGKQPAYGETMCIKLNGRLNWPFTVKMTVWNYDPRVTTMAMKSRVLGSWTHTFARPTCSIAPFYWFAAGATDRRYFDYLRGRSYWRALILQNAVRTKEGRLVDVLNGGPPKVADPARLTKSDRDMQAALTEMRMVIRYRAESEGGVMPINALYVKLAQMEIAAGQREDAARTVRYLQDETRSSQGDPSTAADVERLAKDLGI